MGNFLFMGKIVARSSGVPVYSRVTTDHHNVVHIFKNWMFLQQRKDK
jgi:hypothetical protein